MDIEKDDLVEIERKGDTTQDLMYAGFKAKVVDVYTGGQAFVNLDDYTRETGELQAVSGATMWPTSQLKKIEAT